MFYILCILLFCATAQAADRNHNENTTRMLPQADHALAAPALPLPNLAALTQVAHQVRPAPAPVQHVIRFAEAPARRPRMVPLPLPLQRTQKAASSSSEADIPDCASSSK